MFTQCAVGYGLWKADSRTQLTTSSQITHKTNTYTHFLFLCTYLWFQLLKDSLDKPRQTDPKSMGFTKCHQTSTRKDCSQNVCQEDSGIYDSKHPSVCICLASEGFVAVELMFAFRKFAIRDSSQGWQFQNALQSKELLKFESSPAI